MTRRRATIDCDLPLKRAVDGSDRSKPEGAPARVDAKNNEAEMTCIHDQPGLLAFVVLFLYLPRRARCPPARHLRRLCSGSAGGSTRRAEDRSSRVTRTAWLALQKRGPMSPRHD